MRKARVLTDFSHIAAVREALVSLHAMSSLSMTVKKPYVVE